MRKYIYSLWIHSLESYIYKSQTHACRPSYNRPTVCLRIYIIRTHAAYALERLLQHAVEECGDNYVNELCLHQYYNCLWISTFLRYYIILYGVVSKQYMIDSMSIIITNKIRTRPLRIIVSYSIQAHPVHYKRPVLEW